jgi:hypothetical protein
MNIIKRISYVPSQELIDDIDAYYIKDGYYLDPVVVSNKEEVNWLALTTPHGYLKFRGYGWRIWLLNLYMWTHYHLPWTWKHD